MSTACGLEHSRPAPGVLQLTINRPAVHNAVPLQLQRELDAAVAAAALDEDVSAIVLAGAGGKAFSTGYDLQELAALNEAESVAAMREREALVWRYFTSPKPTIAALTGLSYGAGTILAVCSDLRVGGPGTALRAGAAPYGAANLTWILDTLIGAGRARDLLMSARVVGGEEAYHLGLLDRLVPDAEIIHQAVALAGQLAAQPPAALREIKRLLRQGQGQDLRSRYEHENAVSMTTLKPAPVRESFAAFFEGRS